MGAGEKSSQYVRLWPNPYGVRVLASSASSSKLCNSTHTIRLTRTRLAMS